MIPSNKNNFVTEVKEKVVILEFAIVRIYIYSKGKDFVYASNSTKSP